MSNSGPRWFVECTKTIVVLDNRRRVPSLLSSPLSPSEWFGNHFHRDHRYPGTHPVIWGRFSARAAAVVGARGFTAAVDGQRGSGAWFPPRRG